MNEQSSLPPVEEKPVLENLGTQAKYSLAAAGNGNIYLFHEHEFPEAVNWVEFDVEASIICLVTINGRLQDLGITIEPHLKDYLLQKDHIFVVHMVGGKEQSVLQMPLLIQDYSKNKGSNNEK